MYPGACLASMLTIARQLQCLTDLHIVGASITETGLQALSALNCLCCFLEVCKCRISAVTLNVTRVQPKHSKPSGSSHACGGFRSGTKVGLDLS